VSRDNKVITEGDLDLVGPNYITRSFRDDWFSGMYIWTGWAHISTLELEAR
jgi:hypothetical protein